MTTPLPCVAVKLLGCVPHEIFAASRCQICRVIRLFRTKREPWSMSVCVIASFRARRRHHRGAEPHVKCAHGCPVEPVAKIYDRACRSASFATSAATEKNRTIKHEARVVLEVALAVAHDLGTPICWVRGAEDEIQRSREAGATLPWSRLRPLRR